MNLITVNEQALITAATALVGAEATNAIISAYRMIDQLQREAYELGKLDGKQLVEEAADAAFDEGWDHGYDAGAADGLAECDNAYVYGVRDARVTPEYADQKVASIVAKEALNGEYDADNVQDSGDAQTE